MNGWPECATSLVARLTLWENTIVRHTQDYFPRSQYFQRRRLHEVACHQGQRIPSKVPGSRWERILQRQRVKAAGVSATVHPRQCFGCIHKQSSI